MGVGVRVVRGTGTCTDLCTGCGRGADMCTGWCKGRGRDHYLAGHIGASGLQ